jgi:hypothetical protein
MLDLRSVCHNLSLYRIRNGRSNWCRRVFAAALRMAEPAVLNPVAGNVATVAAEITPAVKTKANGHNQKVKRGYVMRVDFAFCTLSKPLSVSITAVDNEFGNEATRNRARNQG